MCWNFRLLYWIQVISFQWQLGILIHNLTSMLNPELSGINIFCFDISQLSPVTHSKPQELYGIWLFLEYYKFNVLILWDPRYCNRILENCEVKHTKLRLKIVRINEKWGNQVYVDTKYTYIRLLRAWVHVFVSSCIWLCLISSFHGR